MSTSRRGPGLQARCREAGLERARGRGRQPVRPLVGPARTRRLPAVATGSHLDAIPYAGRYDGVVGVLGGLEAIRALRRCGIRPTRSIRADRVHGRGADALRHRLPRQPPAERRARAPRARRRCCDRRGPLARTTGAREPASTQRPRMRRAGPARTTRRSSSCTSSRARCSSAAACPIGVVSAIAGPSSYRLDADRRGRTRRRGADARSARCRSRRGAEIALAVERRGARLRQRRHRRHDRRLPPGAERRQQHPGDRHAGDRLPRHAPRYAGSRVGAGRGRVSRHLRAPRRQLDARYAQRRPARAPATPALVDLRCTRSATALGHQAIAPRLARLPRFALHGAAVPRRR